MQNPSANLSSNHHSRPAASSADIDAMANPQHASVWLGLCSRRPSLKDRFVDLYLAAQLTLLGSSTTPELHA